MEDTLKRLLDAESRAAALVEQAKQERRESIETALQQAQEDETRFNSRLPELKADFLRKAEAQAEQSIGELQRRYRERIGQIRETSERHRAEALKAAMAFIIKSGAKA